MTNKVTIIAEAGVNHNGDIRLAEQLIQEAAKAGADYVKFQTWVTDELILHTASKAAYQAIQDDAENQYQMLKKLALTFGEFSHLQTFSKKHGIKFLSTPDDLSSLHFLTDELKLPIIKIGSAEINNIPYLKEVGAKKKQVILSTGMATLGEVELAFDTLINAGAKNVALLHCTSSYPAPLESVNLKAMSTLQQAFQTTVGYSDHTLGNETALAAVALGAKIIEKHFTLDKAMPGPDHQASINPVELKQLVTQIRNVEKALQGDGRKIPQHAEIENKAVVRKGIYIRKMIKAGEEITQEHLALKRPATEVEPKFFEWFIGKKTKTDLGIDYPITLKDIHFE